MRLAWVLAVCVLSSACNGKTLERGRETVTGVDGGADSGEGTISTSPEGGLPPGKGEAGTSPNFPETGPPPGKSEGGPLQNPACPAVYSSPFVDPLREDSGPRGLAALRAQVLESRAAWERYKADHGNTYRYTRQFDSYFGGPSETTVQVTAGIPTATHRPPGSNGHPAATMDELYDTCLDTVLCQDPRENMLYVHVDARGLLVQCGFFPRNCADDCYQGIEPLILTADGKDWTTPLPGCCEPSPEPDCCMSYGGAITDDTGACAVACDGMPWPDEIGWNIYFDLKGCVRWSEPQPDEITGCCGCYEPKDAGPGTFNPDAGNADAKQ